MKGSSLKFAFPVVLALVLYIYVGPHNMEFPSLEILYPYVLLLTQFRESNLEAWTTHVPLDRRIILPSQPVPEIEAIDYSFESIRIASKNFRIPVIVRGLFKDSAAVRLWKEPERLSSKLGHFQIPVVRNAVIGTLQDHRELENFEDSYKALLSMPSTKEYLFFPVKSRFTFNGSAAGRLEDLQSAVDDICREDIGFEKIWPGFGGPQHKNYAGAQFVIGKSTPQFSNETTGSDWHCAVGNNWFVLVAGRKKWDFVEPRYSHYMSPLKGGMYNMWTGNSKRTAEIIRHIPTWSVVMEEGDLLYNPDWMWHKITNFGGLSIGVPIRERNATLFLRNNFYFSSIVLANIALAKLNMSMGGFPPPSASTEHDN